MKAQLAEHVCGRAGYLLQQQQQQGDSRTARYSATTWMPGVSKY